MEENKNEDLSQTIRKGNGSNERRIHAGSLRRQQRQRFFRRQEGTDLPDLDVAQKEGMEAMCAAYTQQHPEVSIEVQVTSWNEYWTKLEAAATSNQMPDIFWMHTNELLKYADNGMLADCSDIVEKDKFSEISLSNAMGSNGTLYAVPKDKDTVGLVYNKEMFDAAGVAYPDENWTWDDLVSASEKIYAATGKYGYMAYADDQLGYWNFVYQAGGYILNEDKTKAGFTQPATERQ